MQPLLHIVLPCGSFGGWEFCAINFLYQTFLVVFLWVSDMNLDIYIFFSWSWNGWARLFIKCQKPSWDYRIFFLVVFTHTSHLDIYIYYMFILLWSMSLVGVINKPSNFKVQVRGLNIKTKSVAKRLNSHHTKCSQAVREVRSRWVLYVMYLLNGIAAAAFLVPRFRCWKSLAVFIHNEQCFSSTFLELLNLNA